MVYKLKKWQSYLITLLALPLVFLAFLGGISEEILKFIDRNMEVEE
jgi:RsiW-degrading membrane proteinase PrsW (M82 family)